MKRIRKMAMCLMVVMLIIVFAPISKVQAASLKISEKSITLSSGQSTTLKVIGRKKAVTWTSSNKKIASVNSKGVVTAKKAGTVTISAKANGKMAKCKVTVKTKKTQNVKKSSENNLAAYKTVTTEKAQRVGNITYSIKYNGWLGHTYTIYKSKNGKKEVLIPNCVSDTFVTNGKYIYYSTGKYLYSTNYAIYNNRNICRYTIKSGKSEVIKKNKDTGLVYAPFACDGKYLYIGVQTQYAGEYGGLIVINLKTKKSISVKKDVDKIQNVNGKLLVSATGFPHGGALYLMNRDGTGVKLLTDQNVIKVEVKGKYIYFTESTITWNTKRYKCNLDGSNKQILTN